MGPHSSLDRQTQAEAAVDLGASLHVYVNCYGPYFGVRAHLLKNTLYI